nr:hypothetical protein [uncultured Methanolobus sp.]
MEMEKRDIFRHVTLFVSAIFLMILCSYLLFSSSFDNLEERYTMHNTHMLIDEIEDDEVRVLSSSASNLALYAQYEVQGPEFDKFEYRLLNDQLLKNHDVESLLIYNTSTKSLLFDYTVDGALSSSDLEDYLVSNPTIFSKCIETSSLSGLIFLPERTLLVAMEYFTPAEEAGEDGLVIVVSRTIDFNELEIAQDRSISFILEDLGSFSEEDRKAPGYTTGDISISTFENGNPAGAVLLYDMMGNPVKLLKVGTTLQTSSLGLKIALYIGLALLIVSSIELLFHIFPYIFSKEHELYRVQSPGKGT